MNSDDREKTLLMRSHHRGQDLLQSVIQRRIRVCGWAIGLLLSLGLLSSCMIGPNFQRPQMDMPDQYQSARPAPPSIGAEKELARWWEVFGDPVLISLVNRAVEGSLDLKLAEARILQARAVRGEAVSGIGPTANDTGSFSRSQSQTRTLESGTAGTAPEAKTESVIANQYHTGFDASWELDFFGGVRRGIEAANADLESSIESRRDVIVTLTAEVARNYINLRTYQQRIAISRQNLGAQKHSAELTRQRFQCGFVSGLDVAGAEVQVATTAAEVPLLEASERQTIHKLGILLGSNPGALMQELSPALDIPFAPPSAPKAVPSELLRRRPDIRKAEAKIHAETARIGVATSDLYPKFNITGSAGYQSVSASSLFNQDSLIWSFGPSVNWKLFSSGYTRSKIEVQKTLKEQSVIVYRQTVLSALLEVEDALISLEKEEEHRKALNDAVNSSRKAVELATQLYSEGHTDYINVLQAQRSLYAAEDAFVQSTGAISTHLAALYKALGGGWDAASTPAMMKRSAGISKRMTTPVGKWRMP